MTTSAIVISYQIVPNSGRSRRRKISNFYDSNGGETCEVGLETTYATKIICSCEFFNIM